MGDIALDVTGREIQEGDWCVQAFNLGRCAALKFNRVTKVTGDNKLRVRGFEMARWRDEPNWNMGSRDYGIQFSNRSMVVPRNMVPVEVLELWNNRE